MWNVSMMKTKELHVYYQNVIVGTYVFCCDGNITWELIKVQGCLFETWPFFVQNISITWFLYAKEQSYIMQQQMFEWVISQVQFNEFRLQQTCCQVAQRYWGSWFYVCECNSVLFLSVLWFSASVVLHSWVSNKCLYAWYGLLLFMSVRLNLVCMFLD